MPSSRKNVSRRDFLAHGIRVTAGVASAALTSCDFPGTPDATKRVAKTRFGFTTYQWGKDWDIPTLIANCCKAQTFGVELRTSLSYAHGVELELNAQQRGEVKKRFEDSPVTVVGIATSERYDSPEAAKLKTAIENTRGNGFEYNFNLVKDFLGDTLHLHNLKDAGFPYQLQMDLLVKMGWVGWQLLEVSYKVPDHVQALIEQRQIWARMLAKSLNT